MYRSLKKLKPKFATGLDKMAVFFVDGCTPRLTNKNNFWPDPDAIFGKKFKTSRIVPVSFLSIWTLIQNYEAITMIHKFWNFVLIFHMEHRILSHQHGFYRGKVSYYEFILYYTVSGRLIGTRFRSRLYCTPIFRKCSIGCWVTSF